MCGRRGLAATPNGQLTIKNAATATEGALSTVAANVARPGRRPAAAAAAASSGRNNNNYDVNFYRLLSLSLSLPLLPSHCPLSKQLQNKAQHQAGALPMLCVCVCWGRIKIPNKPISKQNLLQRCPLSSVLCPSTIGSNPWFGNFFNASSWGERKRSVRKEGKERERKRYRKKEVKSDKSTLARSVERKRRSSKPLFIL